MGDSRSLYEMAAPLANSFLHAREVLLGSNQSPNLFPGLLLLSKIPLDIFRMIEVVGDRAIDFPDGERRKIVLDLLGSRTLRKFVDD